MSTILALMMVILLLLTERFRRARVTARVFTRHYTHPGHMWVRQTRDGDVMVGIDPLAAGFIGQIDDIRFPRYLKRLHQGEPCCTLCHGSHSITLTCPVSGWVVDKNEMVVHHPSLVSGSPQGEGWLFKIYPSNFGFETRNLLTGRWAEAWTDMAQTHLIRSLGSAPLALSQDGGTLFRDFPKQCSESDWYRLRRELFLDDAPVQRHTVPLPTNGRKEVLS